MLNAEEIYDCSKDYLVGKQGYLLTWDCYKSQADITLNLEFEAMTYVNFLPIGKIEEVKVVCVFDAKSSWSTTKSQTQLNHQQVHFDLGELYARKIRRDLKLLLNKGVLSEKTQLKTTENNYELYSEDFNKYNLEISHGIDMQKQRIWVEKITNQLKQFSEFKID